MGLPELTERFWARVEIRGPNECWPWTGNRDKKGYGCAYTGGGSRLAHRFAWTVTNGAIPDGLKVLHTCDNPACCNPAHHFLGTIRDNSVDMVQKGRGYCPSGELSAVAKFTAEQVAAIRSDERGHTILAREYGVSTEAIRYARLQSWGGVPPVPRRRSHGNAKLTLAQVEVIRSELRPSNELAREFGVSFQTVWRIRKGRGWTQV